MTTSVQNKAWVGYQGNRRVIDDGGNVTVPTEVWTFSNTELITTNTKEDLTLQVVIGLVTTAFVFGAFIY